MGLCQASRQDRRAAASQAAPDPPASSTHPPGRTLRTLNLY